MRPNVVIVKADQHQARCMGANGHPQVRTPHLDRLAADGVNFRQAFVQNPICSPSRMCYLTGQYTHNHGVYGLSGNETLPRGLPSLMSVFQGAGYRTGIVGHIHVQDAWLAPHCDQYRNLHKNPVTTPDAYTAYLAAKGLAGQRDDSAWRGNLTLDACPSDLAFEDSYEGYCLHSFRDFLDDTPAGQPFLYQLDCLHPHGNYIAAREFWDLYEGVELDLPPSANEELSGMPLPQRRMIEWTRTYEGLFDPKGYEHVRRRKLRGYYACISQVDFMLGEVRRLLCARGVEENTILIYCADHGEFATEHGFLEKAPGISYDAVLRTPFLWAWPGGHFVRGVVDELVESIDIVPTICSLADVSCPDTVDGLNLGALLHGDRTPLRDAVFAEFPWSRTIRTKEWLLCHRPLGMFREGADDSEFYDMIKDPWQLTNLIDSPAWSAVRETLRRRLFDWLLTTTRYGNTLPELPQGPDGKSHPDLVKALWAEGSSWGPWGGAYI